MVLFIDGQNKTSSAHLYDREIYHKTMERYRYTDIQIPGLPPPPCSEPY